MKYFLKRGKWCIRDGNNTYKFGTEEEAQEFIEARDPAPYVKTNTDIFAADSSKSKEVVEALEEYNNNTEEG
jgi:hypothetical protein